LGLSSLGPRLSPLAEGQQVGIQLAFVRIGQAVRRAGIDIEFLQVFPEIGFRKSLDEISTSQFVCRICRPDLVPALSLSLRSRLCALAESKQIGTESLLRRQSNIHGMHAAAAGDRH
jgi:hypothetical protein